MRISNESFLSQSTGQGLGILGHHPFMKEMIYIDNYCTGFMILWGIVCITILSTIGSLKNQFFVRFQNITFVCLNLL